MKKYRCVVCGREAESLLFAEHKELGGVWVCRECWERLYEENKILSSTGESSSCCRG
jgi:DNA-directed RNA polymerase subunit RPC12/RpoP